MESSQERTLEERANEVYWSSDKSVNQIADDFDLSKGALYGLIRPLPAGVPCPECSSEMAYANRTARDKGYLSCPSCGDEEESAAVWTERSGASEGSRASAASAQALSRIVLGTALLGVATGVVLTLWARRR
jgi:UDP-N-acetylmuramyl tripeptide synthase